MNIPEGLLFTKEHEWAKVSGNKARIGITQFAVEQLGDITLVELPEVGATFNAQDAIGVIESVKAVSDLYCPLNGKILAVNEGLDEAPEQVNEAPYGDGWMIELEVADEGQLSELMDATAYKAFLDTLDD